MKTQHDLTLEVITDMREWIADCDWADLESEEVNELSDTEVVTGIRCHYEGGVEQFLRDSYTYFPSI